MAVTEWWQLHLFQTFFQVEVGSILVVGRGREGDGPSYLKGPTWCAARDNAVDHSDFRRVKHYGFNCKPLPVFLLPVGWS